MNPKDIINSELICKLAKAAYHNDVVIYSLYDELLRRLSEADALRKENEALRKVLGECPKRNNRLGTYSDVKPVQIDVCKLICMTKESEASHE